MTMGQSRSLILQENLLNFLCARLEGTWQPPGSWFGPDTPTLPASGPDTPSSASPQNSLKKAPWVWGGREGGRKEEQRKEGRKGSIMLNPFGDDVVNISF